MKLSVIHTADRRKVFSTTTDGYKVQRATGVAVSLYDGSKEVENGERCIYFAAWSYANEIVPTPLGPMCAVRGYNVQTACIGIRIRRFESHCWSSYFIFF